MVGDNPCEWWMHVTSQCDRISNEHLFLKDVSLALLEAMFCFWKVFSHTAWVVSVTSIMLVRVRFFLWSALVAMIHLSILMAAWLLRHLVFVLVVAI